MDPKYYGLVEIAFTGSVVLGFAGWQLWSIRRELRKGEEAKRDRSLEEGEPPKE